MKPDVQHAEPSAPRHGVLELVRLRHLADLLHGRGQLRRKRHDLENRPLAIGAEDARIMCTPGARFVISGQHRRTATVLFGQRHRLTRLLLRRHLDGLEAHKHPSRGHRQFECGRHGGLCKETGNIRRAPPRIGEVDGHRPRGVGARRELERRAHNDTKTAKRASQQSGHVVARDVFDDNAAAMGYHPVRPHQRHPDNQVPRRTMPVPAWSAIVRRDNATDRRQFSTRRIERQPLAMLGQHCIGRR